MTDLKYLSRVLYILINYFFKQIVDIFLTKITIQSHKKPGDKYPFHIMMTKNEQLSRRIKIFIVLITVIIGIIRTFTNTKCIMQSYIKYTDQIDLIQINTQVNEKSEQREINKGNNKINEHRAIFQRESQNS